MSIHAETCKRILCAASKIATMHEGWKDRLLQAIDADGRSDRAISLAAGLGPNFISQMRGTTTAAPKKPNIEYVRKLADALGKDLHSIVGPSDDDADARLRSALLAYGVDRHDLDQIVGIIETFLDGEKPEETPSSADAQPASRPRGSKPPKRRPLPSGA